MCTLFKSKFSQPVRVTKELRKRSISLFTQREFSRLFHTSVAQTKYFLETYVKKGLFVRLRQGLYALEDDLPSEEIIANALCQPSYISFEYALSTYGVIPEMPYTITSATTNITCNFNIQGKEFSYSRIKKQAFTGYRPEGENEDTFLIAEPEKALVDYFYFVSLGKKQLNDRLYIKNLDQEKIIQYAELYQRPGLMKLIKDLNKTL